MSNIKIWIKAARLRTLPLALSVTMLGSFLAWNDQIFSTRVLILGLLTTLFLQILSNFANDYGDSMNGMDNEFRVGPKRTVQSGDIKPREMLTAVIITSSLALISGLLLIGYGFNFEFTIAGVVFFLLGVAALAAAIKYTVGKNPYGYVGFGDMFVYIFFGLLGVLGTYYLHTHKLNWLVVLPSSAAGLLSTAVLNLNNMRDIQGDTRSGKRTLVVLMGSNKAHVYHLLLITVAFMCFISYTLLVYRSSLQWIYLVTVPFFAIHLKRVFTTSPPAALDPELKKLALATFVTSLLFGLGLM